jgi:hypothetical protein
MGLVAAGDSYTPSRLARVWAGPVTPTWSRLFFSFFSLFFPFPTFLFSFQFSFFIFLLQFF